MRWSKMIPKVKADLQNLRDLIEPHFSADTAYNPKNWNPVCPSSEHCGVVAALVFYIFGGDVYKAKVEGSWHYFNHLTGPADCDCDLTGDQYGYPPVQMRHCLYTYKRSVVVVKSFPQSLWTRYSMLVDRIGPQLLHLFSKNLDRYSENSIYKHEDEHFLNLSTMSK